MIPQKPRGFRDFYPEDKARQNYIFNTWKDVAERYGFKDVEGPILEDVEIYRKSGQEIPEQMYTLVDKSGRKLALRPELTPTIARMVAQRKDLPKPIKWYSISRCFRYEAPQMGRLREFFQFNIDIIGTKSMLADAEAIATAVDIMLKFGLTKKDFYVRISNRKLFEALLLGLGITKEKLQVIYRLVDKICKIKKNEFISELEKNNLTKRQIRELFKLLSVKKLDELKKYKLDENGLLGFNELKELFDLLKMYNMSEYCRLDLAMMRGFDYYTGVVFEIFDAKRKFRSIAGGGRYDNLIAEFSKESCSAVGLGMGDAVLELFLNERKKLPSMAFGLDFYVAPVNENVLKDAIKIAGELRKKYNVDIDLIGRSLGRQLEYANMIGAKKVVIVGEKDLKSMKVTIRDMKSGKENKIRLKEIGKL